MLHHTYGNIKYITLLDQVAKDVYTQHTFVDLGDKWFKTDNLIPYSLYLLFISALVALTSHHIAFCEPINASNERAVCI